MVSIPYGTIKRDEPSPFIPSIETFQFLMVQLKDLDGDGVVETNEVSIPYGTIKSLHFRLQGNL